MSSEPLKIAVLLATYQGGGFIAEQLDSLVRQEYAHWRLIVSDDGSTDETRDIVQRFAAEHPGRDIALIEGPRRGATQNFLSLLASTQPGEAIAFCDQDDVWLPNRLKLGVAALAKLGASAPALHVTRTTICDEMLQPLAPAPLYRRPPSFRNALVQACTPGNTMLVNPPGAELLRQGAASAINAGVVSHDWWSYQLMTGAGGEVIREPQQTVLYRQHRGNVMGRNDTLAAKLARLRGLGSGDYGRWLRQNIVALSGARDLLTPQNSMVLDRFATALKSPGPKAAAEFLNLGLYRQTRATTAALLGAALAGRLRSSG